MASLRAWIAHLRVAKEMLDSQMEVNTPESIGWVIEAAREIQRISQLSGAIGAKHTVTKKARKPKEPVDEILSRRRQSCGRGLHLVSENDCIVFCVASCYGKERTTLKVM
jgi:hypothetical protein